MKNCLAIKMALGLTIGLGLFLVGPVFAHQNNDNSFSRVQSDVSTSSSPKSNSSVTPQEAEANLQAKKDKINKYICNKIKIRTKNNYNHIKDVSGEISERIDQKVIRAKDFVDNKNLQVSNIDALMADVNSKKQDVASARDNIAGAVANFDCASGNRNQQVAEIRQKVEAYKEAIKAYKQSVRVFLQAVKNAAQAQLQGQSVNQG